MVRTAPRNETKLCLSTSGFWGSVFGGYAGTLDSAGKANATLNLPNIPALVGQRIYTAFALIANGAIDSVSQSANFVVQP